jgi:hypothetical protein
MIADLFFDPESSSYDNYTFTKCGLKWISPTEYVLNSMHDFMFRAALRVGNGIDVQTFTVQRTGPALLFHSDYRYLAAAMVVTLLALLVVIFLLWGWRDLGRPVSLSPLEMAKAFGAPMMQLISPNSTIAGILKEIKGIRVKYKDGVIREESSVILQKAENGERDPESQLETGEGSSITEKVCAIAQLLSTHI